MSRVLDLLADGAPVEEILTDYPHLTREDLQACIAYAAEIARERFVDLPLRRKRGS